MAQYPINLLVTDKVPVAPAGMRSIRLGWKTTKDKATGKAIPPLSPAKYIHVPIMWNKLVNNELSKEENEYLIGLVYEAQDKYVHTLVSSSIEDGNMIVSLSDYELELQRLIEDAGYSSRGQGKLSRAGIIEWFNSHVFDNLGMFILEQPEMADQDAKVAKLMGNYEGYFTKLSSPSYIVAPVVAKKLLEVMQLCEDKENGIWRKLERKLKDMSEEKTAEELGL